jgi:hypothetical protein
VAGPVPVQQEGHQAPSCTSGHSDPQAGHTDNREIRPGTRKKKVEQPATGGPDRSQLDAAPRCSASCIRQKVEHQATGAGRPELDQVNKLQTIDELVADDKRRQLEAKVRLNVHAHEPSKHVCHCGHTAQQHVPDGTCKAPGCDCRDYATRQQITEQRARTAKGNAIVPIQRFPTVKKVDTVKAIPRLGTSRSLALAKEIATRAWHEQNLRPMPDDCTCGHAHAQHDPESGSCHAHRPAGTANTNALCTCPGYQPKARRSLRGPR